MSHISNSETNSSKPSKVQRVLLGLTKLRLPQHKRWFEYNRNLLRLSCFVFAGCGKWQTSVTLDFWRKTIFEYNIKLITVRLSEDTHWTFNNMFAQPSDDSPRSWWFPRFPPYKLWIKRLSQPRLHSADPWQSFCRDLVKAGWQQLATAHRPTAAIGLTARVPAWRRESHPQAGIKW